MSALAINKLACRRYGSLFLCLAAAFVFMGWSIIAVALKRPEIDMVKADWELFLLHLGLVYCAVAVFSATVGVFAFRRKVWAMVVGTMVWTLVFGERFVNHSFTSIDYTVIVTIIAVFALLTIIAIMSRPSITAAEAKVSP